MSSKCGAALKASRPEVPSLTSGTHLLDEVVVDAVAAEVRAQSADRRADGSRLMRGASSAASHPAANGRRLPQLKVSTAGQPAICNALK
jgi:hypothetical protein